MSDARDQFTLPEIAAPETAENATPEPVAAPEMQAEPVVAASESAADAGEPTTPAEDAPAVEAATEAEAEAPVEAVAAEASASDATEATTTAAASTEGAPAEAAADAAVNDRDLALERVRASIASKAPIQGTVIGWNKGGFHVSLEGVAAFCPLSQMELGAGPSDPGSYVDRTLPFRVLREEKEGRRFVVSHAAVLGAERARDAARVREKLQVGATLHGTVSSLPAFGAFIDLGGGIEGLVHVSEIARQRVEKPEEALKIGQQVQVKVLKVEEKGKRISLSIKALEPDPWQGVEERYAVGAPFTGKVLRKSPFGLFVELEPGLEGLLHSSQLPLGTSMDHATLEPGQTISGWIREVDGERRRLALALREVAQGDPWKEVAEKYVEGAVLSGTVEKLEKMGARILLEPGIDGFLPLSEMKLPKTANPGRSFSPGKVVTIQVTSVDMKRRRISLALEGARVEGSRSDLQSYQRKQGGDTGLGAMKSAFARLRKDD